MSFKSSGLFQSKKGTSKREIEKEGEREGGREKIRISRATTKSIFNVVTRSTRSCGFVIAKSHIKFALPTNPV